MKLKTTLIEGRIGELADLAHDAACAHALLQAILDVCAFDMKPLTQRAAELLREWRIEP